MQDNYGDIRDVLVKLPHGDIHGAGSYAWNSNIFTVRWNLIQQFGPRCVSVFEFGALYGYFLVTALDACRYIHTVGWCDNEQHTPHSNQIVTHNVADLLAGLNGPPDRLIDWPRFYRHRDQLAADIDRLGLIYDLVSVDAGHSYDECLADLYAAHTLRPRWVMVDDWVASSHTVEIQAAVKVFMANRPGYVLSEHETVNGLALLTREP